MCGDSEKALLQFNSMTLVPLGFSESFVKIITFTNDYGV
jgi:hypothetical protein